jgi:4-amino-4-deoxy-L-arabinose transferase-like glycosyltransferase
MSLGTALPTTPRSRFSPRTAVPHPLSHPGSRDRRAVLLLTGLCGFLFFYGLTAGELWRTEGLRALVAARFLESGNWIVPTVYGEPLFTKPPGMYAAIALVSAPFGGVSEWTARLPSALAATVTVWLFYCLFRRHLDRPAALVAALMLPTSFMWLDKASAAEIDMLQVAWVTGAILCFLRALESEAKAKGKRQKAKGKKERPGEDNLTGQPRNRSIGSFRLLPFAFCLLPSSAFWWLASLLCVTGGVLTKWSAPAFFYGTIIPYLWWQGRLRLLWSGPHLISAAVAACICCAWAGTAIAMTSGDLFCETLKREALQRLVPNYTPRPYPWLASLVHPFRLLVVTLPWSLPALWSLRPGFARLWDERGRRLLLLLHCWTWPNMLLWSLPTEHAPRHSFPLFPGIAGLSALVWVAWLRGRLHWPWPRTTPARVLAGVVLAWLVVKLVFVQVVVPHRNASRQARARGEVLARLVPAGATLYLFEQKNEAMMFYYGRPVRLLAGPAQLPVSTEPAYCLLDRSVWENQSFSRPARVIGGLADEMGTPMVLVRVGEPGRKRSFTRPVASATVMSQGPMICDRVREVDDGRRLHSWDGDPPHLDDPGGGRERLAAVARPAARRRLEAGGTAGPVSRRGAQGTLASADRRRLRRHRRHRPAGVHPGPADPAARGGAHPLP